MKHLLKNVLEKILKLDLDHTTSHTQNQVQKLMYHASYVKEKDAEYVSEKYQKIQEKLPQIDEMINEKAEKWDTARMSKVDLTILRLAVYEIMFDDSVPTGVAINEAVELAKKFGQDASFSFVNGILAKFA